VAFLLAKPTPLNVNYLNDRFSMFNKKRDIALSIAALDCENAPNHDPLQKVAKPMISLRKRAS
jgi:hypothetical protein